MTPNTNTTALPPSADVSPALEPVNSDANGVFLSTVGGPDPEGGEPHGGDLHGAGKHRVRRAPGVPKGQRALHQVSSAAQTVPATLNNELHVVSIYEVKGTDPTRAEPGIRKTRARFPETFLKPS